MTEIERLYYGLGLATFAVAKADGKIDAEERNKLHEIVVKYTECENDEVDVSEIIFHILSKHDSFDIDMLYELSMKELRNHKDYLTDDMRSDFPAILEKVARSMQPISWEENKIIERFRRDINAI